MAATAFLLVARVVFLRRTPPDLQMRTAAETFRMTRLPAVPANRVIAVAFVISGVLAGKVWLLGVPLLAVVVLAVVAAGGGGSWPTPRAPSR